MIELYSKNNCSSCIQAKDLLNRKGLKYVEFNIDTNYTVEELKQRFPDAKTVPQLVINGQRVAGYEQLVEWVDNYDKSRFLQD